MELVCPAGSPTALRTAVDAGADAVYIGLRGNTNARSFAGLNFTRDELQAAVSYARQRGKRVLMALNTYPSPAAMGEWLDAAGAGADAGVDAFIAADIGLLAQLAREYPAVRRHLSVQASATSAAALQYYADTVGIVRAVLPRVLSIQQVERLAGKSPVELEVFAFGSLCIMSEGRCYLSSYLTGESPNTVGVCSPASAVRWEEDRDGMSVRLNDALIDRYAPNEPAGYPTLCKGRFNCGDRTRYYSLEEPVSLNTLELLPQLLDAGISAVKIEGRQRSPVYVRQVTSVWRAAIDAARRDGHAFKPQAEWMRQLGELSEGAQTTLGAYARVWQ
jgi:putative protease